MNAPREWLEADGLGGFASGPVDLPRFRRYHALLLAATTPPSGRFVLVNGCDADVECDGAHYALTSHRYAPDVTHPDGRARVVSFARDPWPTWTFRLPNGVEIVHEVLVPRGESRVVLSWRLRTPRAATLRVRPFLSGRDPHALHFQNDVLRMQPVHQRETVVVWRTYDAVPRVQSDSNARYVHDPQWYRSFEYDEERARGLDHVEDLASPGVLEFDLGAGEAVWALSALPNDAGCAPVDAPALRERERVRRAALAPIDRAADAYIVARGAGRTIVAGYPWFGDWGRDTFIAMRGLCLARGRLDDARDMLVEWAGAVSEGMLPNRFPDHGDTPEYNAVDASLWYVIAVHEYLRARGGTPERALTAAVGAILAGYARGTRYGIRAADDGLLACGEAGVQLTWMDAKVGDWVVTPRIGKPVEVQALWINALHAASQGDAHWSELCERARASFVARFWSDRDGCLYDVVDVDHARDTVDATVRPNQIFAVGGLPLSLLDGPRARAVVDTVERALVTPVGLRSLASGSPDYHPRYEGGVRERDGGYHQGTVWPWLLAAFVDAWVRVRGDTPAARRGARARFLPPLLAHIEEAGVGHISEIADAEAPHTPRGCPFQAWSLSEYIRLDRVVLA